MDVNRDSIISKSEFMQYAEQRFTTMEASGDGKVTKAEAKTSHKGKRCHSQKKADTTSTE